MEGWNATFLLGLMAYFQVRLELLVSGSTVSSPRKIMGLKVVPYKNNWWNGATLFFYLGISKNRGIPKWMVYNGKPYQNGWFGGNTIFGNTHLVTDIELTNGHWKSSSPATWNGRYVNFARQFFGSKISRIPSLGQSSLFLVRHQPGWTMNQTSGEKKTPPEGQDFWPELSLSVVKCVFCTQKTISGTWWTYIQLHTPMYIYIYMYI